MLDLCKPQDLNEVYAAREVHSRWQCQGTRPDLVAFVAPYLPFLGAEFCDKSAFITKFNHPSGQLSAKSLIEILIPGVSLRFRSQFLCPLHITADVFNTVTVLDERPRLPCAFHAV